MSGFIGRALQILVFVALLTPLLGGCGGGGNAASSNEQDAEATVVVLKTQISASFLQTQTAQAPTAQPSTSVSPNDTRTRAAAVPTRAPSTPTQPPASLTPIAPNTPTLEPTLAPPTAAPLPLLILGLDYQTKPPRDGWIEGQLELGFENIGEKPLPPLCLVFDKERAAAGGWLSGCSDRHVNISEAFIETEEGKNYPVEFSQPAIAIGNSQPELPLPPSLPVRRIQHAGLGGYLFDTAQFRFAEAAHPTALVLRGEQEFRVPLADVPAMLPEPDFERFAPKPITELEQEPLLEENEKIEGTFDGACVHTYVPLLYRDGILLPFTIVNTNKLDQQLSKERFLYAAYFPGNLLVFDPREREHTIGPGQTYKSEIMIFDEETDPDNDGISEDADYVRASHIFVLSEAGDYTVYELACTDQ